jgi:hypothetical protein
VRGKEHWRKQPPASPVISVHSSSSESSDSSLSSSEERRRRRRRKRKKSKSRQSNHKSKKVSGKASQQYSGDKGGVGEFNQPPEEQSTDHGGPSAGRVGDGYHHSRQTYGHHAEGGNRLQAPSSSSHFYPPYQHHGPIAFHGGTTRFHPSNQGAPFDRSFHSHNYETTMAHGGGSVSMPFNTPPPYHHYMNEGDPSLGQGYHVQGGSEHSGLRLPSQQHAPAGSLHEAFEVDESFKEVPGNDRMDEECAAQAIIGLNS